MKLTNLFTKLRSREHDLSQRADVNLTFSVRWWNRYWPIHSRSRKQKYILQNLLVTWITYKRQMVHTMNRTHCSHFLNSFDHYLRKMNSGFQIDSSIEFGLRVPMSIDLCRGDKRTLVVLNFLHLTNDKQKVDKGCRVVNQRWGHLLYRCNLQVLCRKLARRFLFDT